MRLGGGGHISCRMRDGECGAALSLKLAFRGAGAPCQPDSKLFYASGALIFHTVSSHDSLFPQRKIGGMEKKKVRRVSGDGGGKDSLWSIGRLCAWIQVTRRGRWGGSGGGDGAQWGCLHVGATKGKRGGTGYKTATQHSSTITRFIPRLPFHHCSVCI